MNVLSCPTSGLVVFASDQAHRGSAQALADKLGVAFANSFDPNAFDPTTNPIALRFGPCGLVLTDGNMEMRGDFTRMVARIKPGHLSGELLVKAAKVKYTDKAKDADQVKGTDNVKGQNPPLIIDATAGLGEDSLLLAAAGFRVWMFERDPVIAALLEDSLRRAEDDPRLKDTIARMRLLKRDSITSLASLPEQPDVVLLDPMFPERQKSAAVKKKFQLLHRLEHPCTDERELLDAALAAKPRKIVIKRPRGGPYLAGAKPSYSLTGKAIRYDVIVLAR